MSCLFSTLKDKREKPYSLIIGVKEMEKVLYKKFGIVGKRTKTEIGREIDHLKEIDKITTDRVRAGYSIKKNKTK